MKSLACVKQTDWTRSGWGQGCLMSLTDYKRTNLSPDIMQVLQEDNTINSGCNGKGEDSLTENLII